MSCHGYLSGRAGVVSRRQAIAAGMSAEAIDHRLRTRRWRPLHPTVYLVAGYRYDDEARVRAAHCWAGPDAVLSGAAAAWWHGVLPDAPPAVGVTVTRRRHVRPRPGVSLHRRDLAPVDVTSCRGIPVTALALTVLEAAVELGPAGAALLDRALRGSVPFPQVYQAHRRNLGAPGSVTAARLLGAAADRSAQVAVRLLAQLLRGAGLSGWRCGSGPDGAPVEVVFPRRRVAVGVDGWARCIDPARTAAEQRRRQAMVRAGWTAMCYTWHDLVARPGAVLAEIRCAVDAAGDRGARAVAGHQLP